MKMIRITLLTVIFLPSFASAACTNLSSTGEPTITLQNYLHDTGYLSATPNGIYGPATTAAVKKFQIANGISATGVVGQITRLAIQIKSCSTTVVTPTTSTASPQTIPNLISTLSPAFGESLNLGSTKTIQWSGPAGTTYNVVLEDASSTNQGFILAGTRATSIDWTVGSVSANGVPVIVPPGTYRIHTTDASQGVQSTDKLSGIFTIAATPIVVSNVMPQSGKANGQTSVVLYGSGFSQTTIIDFYGFGQINPRFVSRDGKVLVFEIPSGTYVGSHSFSAFNSYQSTDYVSRSADMQFTVTQ
jgi:peptidoglycan hydrolase-like protein with peptidoglycan-binding domain